MIQRVIHTLLKRRHFWRHATFSEIAELYASRLLRMLAMHMAASFISIYLYQIGYSVLFIALFWAAFYLFKTTVALPVARVVAYMGAKHSILISNILYIPSMIAFAFLPTHGTWLLTVVLVFQGLSAVMYQIGYSVDFSKVKSVDHAGKEIAYMNIIEKVTAGLSPLVGGVLAFLLGPQIVIAIAGLLFAVAAIPLLATAEPEQPKQKLRLKGFPWRLVVRNIPAQMALGFDVFTSGTLWTLFTAIVIIGIDSNNQVYIANGILLSVVLFAALGASYMYGRLIDGSRGRELMHFAAIANALTHFLRPFTGSPIAVAGLNVANEVATTGYAMSYARAIYDNADISGYRTAYLGVIEVLSNLGAAIGALVLALLVSFVSEVHAMEYIFFITAAVVLLIITARFPLYQK